MGIRWTAAAAGWVGLVAFVASAAAAQQLTVNDLTGSAVTSVGPYFQDVNNAIRQFYRGEFEAALAHLKEAKKSTPALAPPEVMLAQLHFAAGQPQAGYGTLEQAVLNTPADPEPYVMLIERAAADNRVTEAGLLFPRAEQSLEAFNENARRKANLQSRLYLIGAAIDEAVQRLDDAQAKLEKLVKIDDSNAAAHQRLGRVLYARGGVEAQKRALAAFQRAAELDPKALPAELMMAMLAKDAAKAEQWVEFAIKSNADNLRTQVGAADFRLKQGQLDRVRTHVDAALKIDPEAFESNLLAGLAANLTGQHEKALGYLAKAHLAQPSNANVLTQMTLALLESNDEANRERARQFAEMNARLHPESLDTQALLGWVHYRQKRLAEADRAFQAVFQRAGTTLNVSGDTNFILATLFKDQGNLADAYRVLQPALEGKQMFVYRPQAEKLAAQLAKHATPPGGAAAKSTP